MEDRSMSLKKVFEAARFSQVALVVRDIEEVKKNWGSDSRGRSSADISILGPRYCSHKGSW
jgi:hypothetical protein